MTLDDLLDLREECLEEYEEAKKDLETFEALHLGPLRKRLAEAKEKYDAADYMARSTAKQIYVETGDKTPAAGVTVRVVPHYEIIDEGLARRYALESDPSLLKLNEAAVKAKSKKKLLPGVSFTMQPVPAIERNIHSSRLKAQERQEKAIEMAQAFGGGS